MEPKDKSRQEYQSRINKVMDYIDKHLDKPLTLNLIASVACFSPFHFARLFTLLTGETPMSFIQRLRIEKAAHLLRNNPELSITEIAYMCGFSSLSLFSRTFSRTFGITARAYREAEPALFSKDGQLFSNKGRGVRKNMKSEESHKTDFCIVDFKQLIIMETKIEVKELPDMSVVYCRHTGAFHEIGKAYERLARWAIPRGLYLEGVTKSMTITHDDPSVTDLSKIRQSACILVDKEVRPEGEFGAMTVPGGRYAVGSFELGIPDFEKAWNSMCLWLTESGYKQGEGCPFELYHNDRVPETPGNFVVDICIPVVPL